MKFSAWPGLAGPWDEYLDLCRYLEHSGWDGLWVADHFMPSREDNTGPTGEAWTTLTALATLVPRLRLGTLVVGNTYRHPAIVAKMAAQVDIISGGRLVLGLGAGWQRNEHEAYGIPFYTVGERLRRLRESAQIVKSLFAQERTTFAGRYYTVTDAPLAPKPLQRPGPPLLIGGGGEQVTLKIAARFADEWNVWGTPETLAQKGAILDRYCADINRDPSEIRHLAQALLTLSDDEAVVQRAREARGQAAIAGNTQQVIEIVERYREAGVDELIIPDWTLGRGARAKEAYDRFREEVAANFRD